MLTGGLRIRTDKIRLAALFLEHRSSHIEVCCRIPGLFLESVDPKPPIFRDCWSPGICILQANFGVLLVTGCCLSMA